MRAMWRSSCRLRCDRGRHDRSRRTAERRRTGTVPGRTRWFRDICVRLVRVRAVVWGGAAETPGRGWDVFFARVLKLSSEGSYLFLILVKAAGLHAA
jgi:hypothetical protein